LFDYSCILFDYSCIFELIFNVVLGAAFKFEFLFSAFILFCSSRTFLFSLFSKRFMAWIKWHSEKRGIYGSATGFKSIFFLMRSPVSGWTDKPK